MTERIETAEAFARGWAFPYAYSPADRADLCEAITARDAAVRADERRKERARLNETREVFLNGAMGDNEEKVAREVLRYLTEAMARDERRALPGFETTEEK